METKDEFNQRIARKLTPSLDVLIMLGSLALHAENFINSIPGGAENAYEGAPHVVASIRTNLEGCDEWLALMNRNALLSARRK